MGNYSRGEIFQGGILIKEIRYLKKTQGPCITLLLTFESLSAINSNIFLIGCKDLVDDFLKAVRHS